MPTTIVLPAEMTYVAASFLATVWVLIGQTYLVVRYRGPSGVAYPRLYAEKAEMEANPHAHVFNCIQRLWLVFPSINLLQLQTLEYLPIFFTTSVMLLVRSSLSQLNRTLLTSLKYPRLASCLLGTWAAARIGFTIGYATGNPQKVRTSTVTPSVKLADLLLAPEYPELITLSDTLHSTDYLDVYRCPTTNSLDDFLVD
ncbi:Carboxypeptidase [Mycena indigotica]|uniref:Carboxypeptidase n=1 Tax=Mycena indigotica TaxID=2126181 RepID=A0A8H6VWK9_9AGAR|nr:Carboxypeptidase [Mycena indigotica]KAF7292818.1 Carboxypeptidase [Mycena indigotica]